MHQTTTLFNAFIITLFIKVISVQTYDYNYNHPFTETGVSIPISMEKGICLSNVDSAGNQIGWLNGDNLWALRGTDRMLSSTTDLAFKSEPTEANDHFLSGAAQSWSY